MLREDIEADHAQLLYHSEVRWFSRGLVVKLLFEQKNSPPVKISDSVFQHISTGREINLMNTFRIPERDSWILDPFSVDPIKNDVALPSYLESQLLEVSTDSTLKGQWGKLDLGCHAQVQVICFEAKRLFI